MEKTLYFQAPNRKGQLTSLEDPKFAAEYFAKVKTNQMPKIR